MTLTDAPWLLVIALVLRELRGFRADLGRYHVQVGASIESLRQDVRTVLALLAAQLRGGAIELPSGEGPPDITDASAAGLENQREDLEHAGDGDEDGPGVEHDAHAARVTEEAGGIGRTAHAAGFRARRPQVA